MSGVLTNVYVDGFNLYYGAVRGTPYKWLDLLTLAQRLLKQHHIGRIRYFTAHVKPPPHDPGQLRRQLTYLRALQTIPGLSIHYGRFVSRTVTRPLDPLPPVGPKHARVVVSEEKGSDVNLATYLLVDGFKGDYRAAVVVSNDSDLVQPIRAVRSELRLTVGVLNPHPKPCRQLQEVASFYHPIRKGVLANSQFPDTLTDQHGTVVKPAEW